LRSIEAHLQEFEALGVRPVAISVDSPEDSRNLRKKAGYTFAFLSDQNAALTRQMDLLHAGAGVDGQDISRPAEFLIDSAGVIRWENLTDSIRIRMRPEQALEQAKKLQ
jgi:peroxiredoxin